MSELADRIANVPSFVLRDMWLDQTITTEQYSAEVKRRQVEQTTLVAELVTCKFALQLIIDRTKANLPSHFTRHDMMGRLREIRELAVGALSDCENANEKLGRIGQTPPPAQKEEVNEKP